MVSSINKDNLISLDSDSDTTVDDATSQESGAMQSLRSPITLHVRVNRKDTLKFTIRQVCNS